MTADATADGSTSANGERSALGDRWRRG